MSWCKILLKYPRLAPKVILGPGEYNTFKNIANVIFGIDFDVIFEEYKWHFAIWGHSHPNHHPSHILSMWLCLLAVVESGLNTLLFWVLCTCFRVENLSSEKRIFDNYVHCICLIQGNNGSTRFFASKRHQKTIEINKNLYLSDRKFHIEYNNNINIRQNIFLTYLK